MADSINGPEHDRDGRPYNDAEPRGDQSPRNLAALTVRVIGRRRMLKQPAPENKQLSQRHLDRSRMPESNPQPEPLSTTQLSTHLVNWFREGCPGGSTLHVVSRGGSDGALQQVHAQVDGSIHLDAAGSDGEEVFRRILALAGVSEVDLTPHGWRRAAKRLVEGKLVLITNAWRAGRTRRSSQPSLVRGSVAERLALRGAPVVVDAGPRGPQRERPQRGVITLALDESPSDDGHGRLDALITVAMNSPAIRALALSEPRQVPIPVWNQLAEALGVPQSDEQSLRRLVDDFPDLLSLTDDQVSFVDESVPEEVRRTTSEEEHIRVHRHMTRWLREIAPQLRHPEGWERSGPVGWYAAHGLAMHAVQANDFEALLDDGEILANLPRGALIDAAHCAYDGSLFGSNPAADAVFLTMNGVMPSLQAEWASWLHLMATARGDTELGRSIETSGLRMPWKALWTHWCPPGGYHPSYLQPGPVYELFAVRWKGRPAVASTDVDDAVRIWDLATSELLAGPWADEDFPLRERGSLNWDTESAEGQPSSSDPGPTNLEELRAQDRSVEGPGEDYEFLPVALELGTIKVVGGVGGLLAVQTPDPECPPEMAALAGAPLLGNRTAAGPARPKHAPETTASDLAALFPDSPAVHIPADRIPAGLTDETARRVLMDAGLPTADGSGIAFRPSEADLLKELAWPAGVEQAEEAGPFFRLGDWMGGTIVVDGASGHVLRIPHGPDEDGLEGVLLAQNLDRFLIMLTHWITGLRILERLENSDEKHLLRQHIDDAIWEIDQEGARAGAWTYRLHNDL
ncbi:SUKH-4 family immunity protein [Streptomyces gilvifuscus]|uniref:SUKH-4 family immunity protein n=1 Tax=Streptomyces gilvifuscus TaxID=1550617 RepID=A0ABT5G2C3_9ACTN|nr:SUKH-4 family immunity protein [Streptomyces gilvifuscus]MDC2958781.1 SUKH-4 family immunity protein [Streptomyces gilvifuscus]